MVMVPEDLPPSLAVLAAVATPPQLMTPASLPNLATASLIAWITISSEVTSMEPVGAKTLLPSSFAISALV